jgi:putative transposase
VVVVCRTLAVSRAAYYAHARASANPREQEDARLWPLVRQIFWEHKRRYGARRIAAELSARDESCGPGRVSRLLKQLGLQAIQPQSFQVSVPSDTHVVLQGGKPDETTFRDDTIAGVIARQAVYC